MFRFRLGSIPVEVRASHLVVAALLAWSWMPAAHSGDQSRAIPAIAAGAVVVFISILFHELGHATVALAYGYRPSIVIEYFGGHTAPNATSPMTWWRDVVLTFAGPFFGFCLGLGAAVALSSSVDLPLLDVVRNLIGALFGEVQLVGPNAPLSFQVLAFVGAANLGWSLLNLVPVTPLDGGRISYAILTRSFGRRGVLYTHALSVVICVAAAAWGLTHDWLFLTIFAVMFGYRSVQVVQAYFRQSEQAEPHPADLAFAQAATLFGQQRFEDARILATSALRALPPPPQPSIARLHHLLGWIAVKEGDGQSALDHFSRIGRNNVEPHAMAAAFALTGDDERALSLWELAYRQNPNETVLSEWAGTLIRLGRPEEAARLPGVDLKEAWRAAERLAYLRGDFERAATIGARALELYPSPELAYDSACSYARLGRIGEAQALLERAASLGFTDSSHAETDPDLAALRQTPAFSDWLRRIQKSARP